MRLTDADTGQAQARRRSRKLPVKRPDQWLAGLVWDVCHDHVTEAYLWDKIESFPCSEPMKRDARAFAIELLARWRGRAS